MTQEKYFTLIDPENLFQTEEELKNFLDIDPTKEDLQIMLNICEEKELFEMCKIIFEKMNSL